MTSDAIYTDGTYLARNPAWHEGDSAWKAGHIRALLARNGIEPASVAEVGCGAGEVLVELHRALPESCRFEGYELSPQAFDICAPKARERLSFHLGDPARSEAPPWDVLLLIDVIEHVEDYFAFLRALKGRARHTVLHIPLDLSVASVLRPRRLVEVREAVGHLHYFTPELAVRALEELDYKVIDRFFTAAAIELPAASARTALARLPRRLLRLLVGDAVAARLLGGFSLMVLAE